MGTTIIDTIRSGTMKRASGAIGAVVLSLAMCATASADKGTFKGHAVLNSTKFTEYKALDGHPMKAAMAGELDGLIFYNGGGGTLNQMLDRAHYHVVWVGDGAGGGYCLKTFTAKNGDKLYARCDSRGTDTGSAGVVTLLGGTGAF